MMLTKQMRAHRDHGCTESSLGCSTFMSYVTHWFGRTQKRSERWGAVPADLLITPGATERTLLAVEAEVPEAAYAVIAADRLSSTVQRDEDET